MASLAPKGLMCMREREKTRSEKSRNRGRKRKENKGLDEQFLLVLGVKGGPEEDEWEREGAAAATGSLTGWIDGGESGGEVEAASWVDGQNEVDLANGWMDLMGGGCG